MPSCFIFGAGARTPLVNAPQPGDLVIAADGGYEYARSVGLSPQLLVADFDSLNAVPDQPGLEVIRLPHEKDDTDTYAAIELGQRRGFDRFQIYGGTGGRLDHTIANLECLAGLAKQGERGWLYASGTVLTAIAGPGSVRFDPFPAQIDGGPAFVSVFAHSDRCTGVGISGLKYPLSGATLWNTHTLGVSNEFTGEAAQISVEEGILLISYPDAAEER